MTELPSGIPFDTTLNQFFLFLRTGVGRRLRPTSINRLEIEIQASVLVEAEHNNLYKSR